MSLMEFCEIREGRLAPVYKGTLAPICCDWCAGTRESLLAIGSLWVCPECFGEAETEWTGRGGRARLARRGVTRRGVVRQGRVWQGGLGMVWNGVVGSGQAGLGTAGMEWRGGEHE